MARRSQRPSEEYHIEINSVSVPVKVFYEYRRDVRVALGKDSVRLRIPRHCNVSQRDSYKKWCKDWVAKQWDSNPRFRSTFADFNIQKIESFETFDTTFKVKTEVSWNKHAYGKIEDGTFILEIPAEIYLTDASEVSYKLIHKLLAQHYNDSLWQRVTEIHNNEFAKSISSVKLKNMSSKWGSCSSTGRMSYSTRLLFAPKEVQDYVIVHELCHLNELNHSRAFWDLVEKHDASYRDKEQWLKVNGHLCDVGLG
jgi:predicted metal-dependent hydrolase